MVVPGRGRGPNSLSGLGFDYSKLRRMDKQPQTKKHTHAHILSHPRPSHSAHNVSNY